MKTDIESCPRCDRPHAGLEFASLTNPVIDSRGTFWTHWTPCPTNGEPVLARALSSGIITTPVDIVLER